MQMIYFPRKVIADTNEERKLLDQMIKLCDKYEINVILATTKALLSKRQQIEIATKKAVSICCFYIFQEYSEP